MTPFAAERDHHDRKAWCDWRARAEPAQAIAVRIREMAQALGAVEDAYGDLWPLFAARPINRDVDPGPVAALSPAALAQLIDARCRLDREPPPPAPVGPTGYSITLGNNRTGLDPLSLGVHVNAGAHHARACNAVSLRFPLQSPIWSREQRVSMVLEAIIASWEAQRARIFATVEPAVIEEGPIEIRERTWMTWTREEADSFVVAPAPTEVRTWRGGVLRVWP
jgi:hypothetical protein